MRSCLVYKATRRTKEQLSCRLALRLDADISPSHMRPLSNTCDPVVSIRHRSQQVQCACGCDVTSVGGNDTSSHGGTAALGVRTVEVPRHNTCLEHFPDTSTLGAQHAPTRWASRAAWSSRCVWSLHRSYGLKHQRSASANSAPTCRLLCEPRPNSKRTLYPAYSSASTTSLLARGQLPRA